MRSFTAAAVLGLAATTIAAPTATKKAKPTSLADGFPTPNANQLDRIEDLAFGTLSDAAPPPSLKDDTFTSLRFINFGEAIESFFFNELITNITLNRPGFQNIPNRDQTLRILRSMRATEELHTVNAENALSHFKQDIIQPCQYKFPVSTFNEAIAFISTATDNVQGVLGDVINKAAAAGDAGFTRGVSGALSNEGEQDGWFRFIMGQNPNQKPFNTISTREYAFSVLQGVVVPGSCANADLIDLTIFPPLSAANPPAKTTDIDFTFSIAPFTPSTAPAGKKIQSFATQESFHKKHSNVEGLSIAYLNGQDKPICVPVKSLHFNGFEGTAKAEFPFDEFKMHGLSVAALVEVDAKTCFANQDEMVKATAFGPALLEPVGDERI
ncbi:hypothetical protein NA57DRAFT_58079 [Rhizodiscina lignyota]|uniref:Sexual development protein n=1 Tax=Rhizodiscina lignyota TaxID=1504668 RepID=A0A9P4M497_9PEZI|nr:hypothetical protein NA57DRAFT_58079 [Rhizodiscina lignyota]